MIWLINEWAEIHLRLPLGPLCRDLMELLNVESDPQNTAASYEEVLLSIRKEYFDVLGKP